MITRELDSAAIEEASYEAETKRMTITFKGGRAYDFEGVPEAVFNELCDCESAGAYFANEIKGKYNAEGFESIATKARPATRQPGQTSKPRLPAEQARPLIDASDARRRWDR